MPLSEHVHKQVLQQEHPLYAKQPQPRDLEKQGGTEKVHMQVLTQQHSLYICTTATTT